MTATIEDQPPPIPQPDRVPVWGLVITDYKALACKEYGADEFDDDDPIDGPIVRDMEARDKLGRERYGTPLTTGNGRDHLVDAYQELLDFAVYLRAWLEEHPKPSIAGDVSAEFIKRTRRLRVSISEVGSMYRETLRQLWNMRRIMAALEESAAKT